LEEHLHWIGRCTRSKLLRLVTAFILPLCAARVRAQETAKPIRIAVDLRDAAHRVFHARLEIPVHPGPLTLVYPEWIPGEHGPTGPITDLTGLRFSGAGQAIPWRRDDVDFFAFHLQIPTGVETLEVSLDFLPPSSGEGLSDSPSTSARLAVLSWNQVLLYPQGTKTDDLTFGPTLRVPAGWQYATALQRSGGSGEPIEFEPVSLTTLVDSPVLLGEYLRTFDLTPGQTPAHRLNVAADSPAATAISADELKFFKQLVAETGPLFGARHYRHYDFLLALSDFLDISGLEHHESSDDREHEGYLLDPDIFEAEADLLPHEFFHSWNGKYRRPAGLATPDYQAPMRDDLLWVYEGLTDYYGGVLTARGGYWSEGQYGEYLAYTAAGMDVRPGRAWRNLEDTAIAAPLLYDAPKEGAAWRRAVDFYEEGVLIWLEADTIIRRQTHGKRSLDDFCRKFHGEGNSAPRVVPYTSDDVVAALNDVTPYDWRGFFTDRLTSHGPGAPLGGITGSGWRLVFTDKPNAHQSAVEYLRRYFDARWTVGFVVYDPGSESDSKFRDVIPGTPAGLAGIPPGARLVSVNDRHWTPEILRQAIRASKESSQPIELLVDNDDFLQTYHLDYHGGERYPHLERDASVPDLLSDIVKARAAAGQ
jgi:predicted metalloprotease with PDZ domain